MCVGQAAIALSSIGPADAAIEGFTHTVRTKLPTKTIAKRNLLFILHLLNVVVSCSPSGPTDLLPSTPDVPLHIRYIRLGSQVPTFGKRIIAVIPKSSMRMKGRMAR